MNDLWNLCQSLEQRIAKLEEERAVLLEEVVRYQSKVKCLELRLTN